MNINDLKLDKNGITSIIARGYIKGGFIDELIGANKDKRITMWQNCDRYYLCDRLCLNMATDLRRLLLENHDFDILIIDCFVEWCNTREVVEFLKYVKDCSLTKNKKIVIFFKVKWDDKKIDDEIRLEDFKVYKEIIEKVSNDIYLINKEDVFTYKMQDKEGNALSVWNYRCSYLHRVEMGESEKNTYLFPHDFSRFILEGDCFSTTNVVCLQDANGLFSKEEMQELSQCFSELNHGAMAISAENLINEHLSLPESVINPSDILEQYDEYNKLLIYNFEYLKGKENSAKFVCNLIERFYQKNKPVAIISQCDIKDIEYCPSFSFYNKIDKYIVE